MDFQSALIGQLDPTKKKLPGDDLAQAAVQPGGMEMGGAMGAPGGFGGNTGINGRGTEVAESRGGLAPGGMTMSPAPVGDAPIASPIGPADAPKPASDFGRTMGYDPGKFNDPNKHDFKYDTARVLSRFDPKAGFTPDVINALNGELGGTYGNFSDSGDKLSLSRAKNAKDAADFANQDWIYAHKTGNDATKWNFGGGGAAPADGPAQGGGGMFGGSSISPILQGDAQGNIQSALSKLSAPSDMLQQLLAQLQGGQ